MSENYDPSEGTSRGSHYMGYQGGQYYERDYEENPIANPLTSAPTHATAPEGSGRSENHGPDKSRCQTRLELDGSLCNSPSKTGTGICIFHQNATRMPPPFNQTRPEDLLSNPTARIATSSFDPALNTSYPPLHLPIPTVRSQQMIQSPDFTPTPQYPKYDDQYRTLAPIQPSNVGQRDEGSPGDMHYSSEMSSASSRSRKEKEKKDCNPTFELSFFDTSEQSRFIPAQPQRDQRSAEVSEEPKSQPHRQAAFEKQCDRCNVRPGVHFNKKYDWCSNCDVYCRKWLPEKCGFISNSQLAPTSNYHTTGQCTRYRYKKQDNLIADFCKAHQDNVSRQPRRDTFAEEGVEWGEWYPYRHIGERSPPEEHSTVM